MSAALSQVSLVSGLGSSWSQPLLANRPSQIVGSGRKTISRPSAAVGGCGAGAATSLTSGATAFGFDGRAGDDARRRAPSARPPRSRPGSACRFQ